MPGIRDTVPLEPFQRRLLELERQGTTAVEIAGRLGWLTPSGPDSSRVRRAVGLRGDPSTNGAYKPRRRITFEQAKRLADAMDIDYHEVGL